MTNWTFMLVKCGMVRAAKQITSGIIPGYQHLKHALHKVLWPMGWAEMTLFAHAVRVIGAIWSWIPGSLLLLKKNAFLHAILHTKVFWSWQGCIVPSTDAQPAMLPSLLVWNYCHILEIISSMYGYWKTLLSGLTSVEQKWRLML